MTTTLKRLFIIPALLAVLLAAGFGAATPALSHAQSAGQQAACEASGGSWSKSTCLESKGGTNPTTTINKTIKNIINVFSTVIGVVAVIMVIIGGFNYITSGGDSSKTKKAKDTIMYAVIGLVIVAMAQIIVRFVLHKTT